MLEDVAEGVGVLFCVAVKERKLSWYNKATL